MADAITLRTSGGASETIALTNTMGTGEDGAAFRDFGPAFWRHPGLRGGCAALRRPWSLEPPMASDNPSGRPRRQGRCHQDGAYNIVERLTPGGEPAAQPLRHRRRLGLSLCACR